MYKSLLFAVCCLVIGCVANVTHKLESADATGIRYYENSPYLIVYSDGKGGLRWQIRYLPDQSRLMTVKPTIFGSRAEMTLYFQNGVLTSASALGDSTEIPKAIIGAVEKAIPFFLAAVAAAGPQQNGFPPPYLYKIVVDGENVTFIGGKGDSSIQVPISEGGTP
jgi:hypothetical protein